MLLSSQISAEMFAQLAAMEKAGLPADKAWSLLKSKDENLASSFQMVSQAIKAGKNIAVSAKRAMLFTTFEANLVSAALEAGSPAHVYERLAFSYTQRSQNEGKIRSRMIFPIATLILALFVQPLPQLVAGTLGLGGYLGHVLGPLLILYVLFWLFKQVKASTDLGHLFLKVPVYGPVIARKNALRFYESLGLLLEAGVAMFEALPTAAATIEHPDIRVQYEHIKANMQRGNSLSEAIATEITNPMYLGNPQVTEFIATGEASGTLPEMLLRHVNIESESLSLFWSSNADWIPKIAYAFVAAWMAYSLLAH